MISNMDQKTETFFRKQNETLSAMATSLKSIDRSLQRIAVMTEKNETMIDMLTKIGEGYPAFREELAAAGVKEDDNGRTSA